MSDMRGSAVVLLLFTGCAAVSAEVCTADAAAAVSKSTESASGFVLPWRTARKPAGKHAKSKAVSRPAEVEKSTATAVTPEGATPSAHLQIAGSFTTVELEHHAFRLGEVVYNSDIEHLCIFLRQGWRRVTGAGGPCK